MATLRRAWIVAAWAIIGSGVLYPEFSVGSGRVADDFVPPGTEPTEPTTPYRCGQPPGHRLSSPPTSPAMRSLRQRTQT
jgi:hypothetical protein